MVESMTVLGASTYNNVVILKITVYAIGKRHAGVSAVNLVFSLQLLKNLIIAAGFLILVCRKCPWAINLFFNYFYYSISLLKSFMNLQLVIHELISIV